MSAAYPHRDRSTRLFQGHDTSSSRDRIGHVAQIVANGLTSAAAKAEDRGYLLRLLEELNDVEVLVLAYYGQDNMRRREEFYEQHRAALQYEPAGYGDSQETIDRQAVRESYSEHLVRLGLLQHSGDIEVDDHFRAHGSYCSITDLGRYLLGEIVVMGSFEKA